MSVDQIPIGKFSFMTRLSQKALRLYDRKGLLVPEAKDPFTGYRCYTVSQLEKGMKIKTLSFLGFSLEDISLLLDAESKEDYGQMRACFRKKLEETEAKIGKLQLLKASCRAPATTVEQMEKLWSYSRCLLRNPLLRKSRILEW